MSTGSLSTSRVLPSIDTSDLGSTLSAYTLKPLDYAFQILDHIYRPEAKRHNPFSEQLSISRRIATSTLVVLRAIDFHSEVQSRTVGIQNVGADRKLSTKTPAQRPAP